MVRKKKPRSYCIQCAKETKRSGYKYCSNKCQAKYQYLTFIKNWKLGREKGIMSIGIVSHHIKRYLREKYKNRCCLCGWSEVNQKTGKVPLVADHIDGNWRNNVESNLRLICPNCDSLTSTYAALNKGNGRRNRRKSNRSKEAQLLYGMRSTRKTNVI